MTDNPTSPCCCNTSSTPESNEAADNPGATNLLDPPAEDHTTCPVMPETPVVKSVAEAAGLFRDYEGTRYWFCCKGCGPRFDRNPEKYASVG